MKPKKLHWIGCVVLIGILVCAVVFADKDEKSPLPAAVKSAIKALYPDAAIEEAEVEEEGLLVYEAELVQNGQEFEVTITPDGTLMEVEAEVSMEDIPPAVAQTLAQETQGAQVKEIEKEVIYAVLKVVKLPSPQTIYEAEVIINGKEVEIEIAADGKLLSKEVQDDDDGHEGHHGEKGHRHDDDDDDDEEDEEEVAFDDLPAAVKATILSKAGNGTIEEIEREIEDGQIVYEAEVVIDGVEYEIEVAADGTLLEMEEDDDDEDDDDDDDDD